MTIAGIGHTIVEGISGNLQIGFALAPTNDLYYGGRRFSAGTAVLDLFDLGKDLEQLGFNFFSFVLVHQLFFLSLSNQLIG